MSVRLLVVFEYQLLTQYIYEKMQFNSLVWGLLMLTPIRSLLDYANLAYVAVPDRNQILFRCIFREHHRV